jgi:hypothetical protein
MAKKKKKPSTPGRNKPESKATAAAKPKSAPKRPKAPSRPAKKTGKKPAPRKSSARKLTLAQWVDLIEDVVQEARLKGPTIAGFPAPGGRAFSLTNAGRSFDADQFPDPSETRTVLVHMQGHDFAHSASDLQGELGDPIDMIDTALHVLEALGLVV